MKIAHPVALIIDLDGTLVKSDCLYENANAYLVKTPLSIFKFLLHFLKGRARFKYFLSSSSKLDADLLPYNMQLINWIQAEKDNGRHIILATASHRLIADSVAMHLNLFDEVFATEGDINLKSYEKQRLIVSKFGELGFDYVGNEMDDIPVWKSARNAYIVTSSSALVARVSEIGNLAQVFDDDKPPLLQSLLKAMRPHQWLKNILIFVPLFAAQLYGDISSITNLSLAFIVFGLTASSAYILNDLVDIENDRRHPRKKLRPFAAGNVNLLYGWLLWPTLLVIAFTISILTLPKLFLAVQASYLALTFAYSFFLKKKVIVDVITLAGLYTIRIIAGITAISVPLSFWLLSFSMFIFSSLAFVKRFSEIKTIQCSESPINLAGRGYFLEDLELVSSMGIGAGYISVLVLALYIQDISITHLYHRPEFIWLACPLLLFWISRIWLIAHRGNMHDDPVYFAAKDRTSWFILVGFAVLFLLARFI